MATETMPMYVAKRSQDRNAVRVLDPVCHLRARKVGEGCTSLRCTMVSGIGVAVIEEEVPEPGPLGEDCFVVVVAPVAFISGKLV